MEIALRLANATYIVGDTFERKGSAMFSATLHRVGPEGISTAVDTIFNIPSSLPAS